MNEHVTLITTTGNHDGVLGVSAYDGLPELYVVVYRVECYRPWTLPYSWTLSSSTCGELYQAWRASEAIMERLRAAQLEAEQETRREPDDIDAYKRDAAARGTR